MPIGSLQRLTVQCGQNRSRVNNPPHPGGGLRYDIEAVGWTVAECAKRFGLSRATLSRVLNGKQAITPAIALALEQIDWSDAETW